MNQMPFESNLSVCLIESELEWAESGIQALRNMVGVRILDVTERLSCDVILYYGEHADDVCHQYGYGRLGFWFFRWSCRDTNALSAAQQSAAQNLPLEVSLWTRFADGRCECLYQSFGFLEPFALKRCVRQAKAKAAYFPNRVLSSYLKKNTLPFCVAEAVFVKENSLSAKIAELKAQLQKGFRKILYKEQWFVIAGVGSEKLPTTTGDWFLEPGSKRFWADPFPIEHENRRWIVVEELWYSTWRGNLAVIELFSDGAYSDSRPIMVADKHLSYPFIFSWTNDLYMVPESCAARQVTLWKCVAFPDQWQQVAVLLPHVYAADATLIEYQGCWWMFVNIAHEGGCANDELHIYYADSPLGPWQAHAANPVKSDARNARPAGNLFIDEGVLYRPAQDCGHEYGKATVLNRIDCLDKDSFSETQVARLDSSWGKGFLRTHTLSRSAHLWAIDGYRLWPKWRGFF